MDLRRLVPTVGLAAALMLGVVGYTVAQDSPATPVGGSDLCASPEATPSSDSPATPDFGTPGVDTSGSPEAVATSVIDNIQSGLDTTACGTPDATPAS
jgi:hypothetical protein